MELGWTEVAWPPFVVIWLSFNEHIVGYCRVSDNDKSMIQWITVLHGDTDDPKYHPHPMLLTTCDSFRTSHKPSIGSLTCSSCSARCLKQGRRLRMFLQQAVRLPVLSVQAVSFPDFAKACPCVSQHISTVLGCQSHIYSTFWPMDSPHGSHHITSFLHSFSLKLVLKLFLGHKPWNWHMAGPISGMAADPNCRLPVAGCQATLRLVQPPGAWQRKTPEM